ncbi:MAG: FAD-dependent oxidoreductase [Candidatus Hydrogenedentes bacterium]|nr:FAD-dependent oxidoreductase [Candidatus Hydrogenedentota bacterium]
MGSLFRVVVIGGVAAGTKTASKITRLRPDADVTVLEKGEFLSYAGCGLPYFVSGVVKTQHELMATPVGVVRDSVFFSKVKNVHVLNHTEALAIDRTRKHVRFRRADNGEESELPYDKLMLGTGANPVIPPLPGVELRNVFTLHGVHDAVGVRDMLREHRALDVVIVGGGLIGLEMTEALVETGCRVTVVEMLPQILPMLDWEMAKQVEQHLESHGVRVMTGTRVLGFEGDGAVHHVRTDHGELSADMVILSVGVRPNVSLAVAAGLKLGPTGAIAVNDRMQTSDPDIYAAGDCVENKNLLTGKPCFVPLGSTANKQGRVAAINICGGDDTFPGVLGSTVCKVFDFCVGRTGLTETEARREGIDVETVLAPSPDKAHYMPTAKTLMLKLVIDRGSRKLLGAQAVGPGDGSKRIDVAAMALTASMTVDQLDKVDLCYAPPFSPAMDNLITAADVGRNKLDGHMTGVTPMDVYAKQQRGEDFIFLDVRSPEEYGEVQLPGTINIPLGALRKRFNELDRNKEIITFCKISLRGYEAALILRAAGFDRVRVMDGGLAMWPYPKVTV